MNALLLFYALTFSCSLACFRILGCLQLPDGEGWTVNNFKLTTDNVK